MTTSSASLQDQKWRQPKAIQQTLEGLKDLDKNIIVQGIFAAVPYCIDLIGGPFVETNNDIVKAFRPKK